MRADSGADVCGLACTCASVYTRTHTNTHIHIYIYIYIYIYIHIHTHTHLHTPTHSHTHTHTHTRSITMMATRDIAPGEELFQDYVSSGVTVVLQWCYSGVTVMLGTVSRPRRLLNY